MTEFRSHLADVLDEVAHRREHVTITRHGRPSAVLIPVHEYEALEERAEILSDDGTLAAIRRGLVEAVALPRGAVSVLCCSGHGADLRRATAARELRSPGRA